MILVLSEIFNVFIMMRFDILKTNTELAVLYMKIGDFAPSTLFDPQHQVFLKHIYFVRGCLTLLVRRMDQVVTEI